MTSQEEMGHPNDNDHQLSVFVTIGLNELHTRLLVENDAKAALGTSRIFSTQDKQDYLKIMQIRKENIREWSRQRIEKLMLAEAIKQELRSIDGSGALVCTLKEVQQVFAMDGSLETGRKVWHVCFHGSFVRNDWDTCLEAEYMHQFKLQYLEWANKETTKVNKRQKGCIAKLIVNAKNQLVHNINECSRNTHGRTVVITRTTSEVEKDGRTQFRRDKNTYYDFCFRHPGGASVLETDGKGGNLKVPKHKQEAPIIAKSSNSDLIAELQKENIKVRSSAALLTYSFPSYIKIQN